MPWASMLVDTKPILETVKSFGASQWTAVFAAALTLTSFAQGLFILQANRVAKAAAQAAKKTADWLQIVEGAYVAEQIVHKDDIYERVLHQSKSALVNESAETNGSPDLSVTIKLVNFGKTPAMLKSWAAALFFDSAVRTPDLDPRLFPIRMLGPREQSGEYGSPVISVKFPSPEQSKKFKEGSLYLWVKGYIDFEDIHGHATKREFVWRYDVPMKRFVPHYFNVTDEN